MWQSDCCSASIEIEAVLCQELLMMLLWNSS